MAERGARATAVVVIGAGYVGLTTAACLASLGHRVVCADVDAAKVDRLRAGRVDILEPGLPELVAAGLADGSLRFELGAGAAVRGCVPGARAVFLCVPTPSDADGRADLTAVESAVDEVAGALVAGDVLVLKSTVPVGTTHAVRDRLRTAGVAVASNPEFLREGSAVTDFLHPDRLVIGCDDPAGTTTLAGVYAGVPAPVVVTDPVSAELVKYAANCFLALKLSYVNSIAELCERVGGDIGSVAEGMGHDPRIGPGHLRPGPGWGGSCLPKDTRALLHLADRRGVDLALVRAAADLNSATQDRIADKVRTAAGEAGGDRVAVLGLAFKAGTNDLRESPALAVAARLSAHGLTVVAHDPAIAPGTAPLPGITLVDDVDLAVKGAAAVALLTDWPQYRALDWNRVAGLMAGTVVVDTRNQLDPEQLRRCGLDRRGIGV
ncbi:UDP-glucose dehydrogenase family protein [Lentzea chajnantorensis]